MPVEWGVRVVEVQGLDRWGEEGGREEEVGKIRFREVNKQHPLLQQTYKHKEQRRVVVRRCRCRSNSNSSVADIVTGTIAMTAILPIKSSRVTNISMSYGYCCCCGCYGGGYGGGYGCGLPSRGCRRAGRAVALRPGGTWPAGRKGGP